MLAHTENFFINTAGFLIAVALIIYTYFRWSYQYWERKGVPFLTPRIPFGTIENPLAKQRNTGAILRDNYNEFRRRGVKFGGVYLITRPVLLTVDPEIVRSVLAKDFK